MKFPSKRNVFECLRVLRNELKDQYGPGNEEDYCDVRLQVYDDGEYSFHSGDAQYDQDHRGYWGAGCITPSATNNELWETADDLIDQAKDHHAQSR